MIRAVLVEAPEGPWRLYRQQQWMAEVRRDPSAADRPRHHFDIEEPGFAEALEALPRPEAEPDPLALLARVGAIAVPRP